MADTKRRIKNEEIKKETTEPEAVSQSTAMQERMESVSRKILITARNELYMKMRFLDVALSCMPFIPDTGADGMGTDGLYLYYDPQYLGGLFREDRVMVNRIYLHLVLHGIFRHMLRRKEREERSYHLACDIVAESIIEGLGRPLKKDKDFQRSIGKFGRSDRSGEGREPGTDGLPGILTEVFGFKRRDDGRPGFV